MSSYNNFNSNCSSNPFLDWMNSPVSQSSAIAILAQFYNHRDLSDILHITPQRRRAGVLVSLLYEVCGRILDPENGLEGLFKSGHWEKCYYAVRDILQGKIITPLPPSNQINNQSQNVVVTRDEHHTSFDHKGKSTNMATSKIMIDNKNNSKGKRPMVEDGGDEEPRNPSKRPCSRFERGDDSSGFNQQSDIIHESSSSNFNQDEVSLELTLGQPKYSTDKNM